MLCVPNNFPALDLIFLLGIGEKENLGITMEMFASLLARKVSIEIHRGFNQKSIQDAGKSPDGAVVYSTLTFLQNPRLLARVTPDNITGTGVIQFRFAPRPFFIRGSQRKTLILDRGSGINYGLFQIPGHTEEYQVFEEN